MECAEKREISFDPALIGRGIHASNRSPFEGRRPEGVWLQPHEYQLPKQWDLAAEGSSLSAFQNAPAACS
jgi:hypothetical protein